MRRLAAAMYGLLVLSAAAGAAAIASSRATAIEAAPATAPPPASAAAKAFNVLATYCAGCHQAGRSVGGSPRGDLDDILDLAALAREPSLVRPGQPDASALHRLLMQHPRLRRTPGAHEIEAVDLDRRTPQAPGDCGDRPLLSGIR
jgi:mono/diheme cytochrome c family protein